MLVTNLDGHSGCQVLLYETDNNSVFVRKISSSQNYNSRLKNQCEKQNNFKKNGFCTPEIYNDGYTEDGMYFFDMEYINGMTLAEYIKTVETVKINGFVNFLLNDIQFSSKIKYAGVKPEKKIETKINELWLLLSSCQNKCIDIAISLLKNHNWSTFSPSQCHGDLTFENIIVKNDKFYYIDFLDSFYDSYLIDLGSVYQDVLGLWSFRNSNLSSSALVRLIVFRDLLSDKLKMLFDETTIEDVYYSLLLKLIRIYPYTSDKNTLLFLDSKVKMMIKKITSGKFE